MSVLKDISIETIRKMPESATAKDMIREVELIEYVIERVKDAEEDFRKFRNLAEKWKEETLLISSVNEIESNQSYLEIIDMGRKALPYIFQDLKSEMTMWFPALEAITAHNPVKPSHRGIIKLMREDWLKWGEENGYI